MFEVPGWSHFAEGAVKNYETFSIGNGGASAETCRARCEAEPLCVGFAKYRTKTSNDCWWVSDRADLLPGCKQYFSRMMTKSSGCVMCASHY